MRSYISFPRSRRLRFVFQFAIIFLWLAVQSAGGNLVVRAAPVERPLFAPVPSVTLSVPANPFIGEPLSFTVAFDNTDPTDTGYGPYIDLFLPLSGADGLSGGGPNDGISFVGASYLGSSVTTNVLNCPAGSNITHPLTGQNIACPAQPAGLYSPFTWQLVVITLPFGSFVPSQPPATVTVNANLSNYADLGVALPIWAQGGFMFGADPLNNPATDPPITGSPVSTNVTPTLLTLSKSYNGPEDETATGPNFPRRYTVTAQIAPGQSMTAFNLTDVLPDNMQFVSLISTSPGGASCSHTNPAAPGGTLSCNFSGSVSGTVTMTFEYYIPLRDAGGASVIDPVSGDDATSCNNASGGGTWATPLDPRDSGSTFTQNPAGCEHTLTDKSIAIQKSVSVVGGGIPKPGAVLEYTLNFQVSDFFAFQNISITDIISDGQHFDSSFTPTLQINGNTYTLPAAAMNLNNVDVACNYTGGPGPECDSDNPAANDGTTTITFDVSPEIIARGQDGRLIGGCVPTSGTGGGDPNCNSYNDGPTTGTIVFRTVIQENFTDTYPSGDPSVDQGDVLNDTVTISGDLLSTSDASTPTGQSEADTSAASVSIPRGTISKSIYALNGSTSFSTPVRIAPGDTVTYRITYTLPTSDFEDLVITDYLPLPIYDATEVTPPFNNTICGVPAAGVSCLGPSDTYHSLSGAVIPTLTTSSAANSITWTYGDYDAPGNPASTIDLLFTVTVNNQPFADGLYLTNQANVQEGSTNASSSAADAIIQVQLQEPVVGISKGVVWTNNPAGVFSPSPVGPVTFTGSGCPAFTGTITSPGLASNPVNSNLSGVDAGDQVMMAIILENTGRYSAFDVRVRDSLPTGMTLVPGSVCVTDGTGAPISTTDLGGGLFGSGLELDDPGPTASPPGALDPGKNPDGSPVNTGRNIAVITYLVTLDTSVQVGQTLTNTATLFNYAGAEGGPDHTGDDPTDTASVTITKPLLSKALTSTNQSFTSGSNVAVGEMVTYTITITVPEGTTPNAVFSDTLDPGLAFVSCDSITASPSVSATAGFNCANAVISNNSGGIMEPDEANARVLTYNFGDITNTDTNNSTAETITIQYTAVVLNSASINRGWVRSNYAGLWWTGGSQGANITSVTVVEPTLQVNKTAAPTTGDAGDTITYTAVLSHTGASNADAFEAHLRDDLSTLPVTLNIASITVTPGAGCGSPTVTNNSTATVVDITVTPFPLGCSVTVTYQVTLNGSVSPGQTITNTANIDWTSLPGNIGQQTPNNTLSCERTGDTAGCGGTNNDYTASDPATVTVNVTPVKSIVATSEDSTGPQGGTERLVIGEIVRYRLQVQWPEGTSVNAMLRDNLPAGLQFLNDGTARVAFVCNSGPACMASTNPLILSLPVVSGNETTVASITPSFVLPDDAVSSSATTNNDTYGSDTDPYFKFSDLVNSDNDSDQEFIVVEFNALVLNIVGNQNNTPLNNSFTVLVNGSSVANSNTVTIRVAEPSLSLSKVVTTAPTDAGDPITYTLTITNNSSGPNRATAFDLELTDNFDANLTGLSVSSVTTTQGGTCVGPSGVGTTAFSHNGGVFVGNTLTFTATCLDPGQTITLTITGTVAATAPAGYTIPNSATVTYTSLPGSNGASSNPTGSVTPGASGSGTGERNGQDGVGGALNDYAATASASASLSAPQIDKRTPTPASAPIGATVTFPILVTLPEGVTQSLVVTDNLPVGLVYVSHSVVTTAAASGGLLAADYNGTLPAPTVTAPGGSGDDLTLNFGNVTTAADNVTNNNAFVIFVTARVNNEPGNQNGTVLANTASLTYTDPDTGTTTIADPTAENVTVLEPELNIVKSADDTTPAYGQTLTYTLTVSHLASSTSTAYDIVVTDTIPAGLTYVAGSISAPAGWTVNDAGAPTLTWSCSNPCSLPVGNTASLSYQVTVNGPPGPPNPGDVLTNTASMTWTSLDGTDPNERTGAGGINDYADSDGESVTFTAIDLTISKDDGSITSSAGGVVQYTLSYSNAGNSPASGVIITEIVPANTTFNAGASTSGWSCADGSPAGTTCTFTVGTLNPGSSGSVIFAVTVDNPLPAGVTQIANTASIGDDGTHGLDADSSNNSDSDTTPVEAAPDLVITKDDGFTVVSPGQFITYTLTIRNVGTQDATGVVVTDTLPANTTFVSASDSGTYDSITGVVTWPAFDLAAGASVTRTVTIQVNDPFPSTSILNQAHVEDDGSNGSDLTPANNDATDTDSVVTLPNSDLTKSIIATDQSFTIVPYVAIGEILTYEVVFTVPAGGTMSNLTLTDTLDRGLAFVDCVSVTVSDPAITTTLAGGFADACNDPTNPTVATEPSGSTNPADAGRRITFTFGDVSNSGTSDGTVSVRYTVVVLDSLENQDGISLNNSAALEWDSGSLAAFAPPVEIIEPSLSIHKNADPTTLPLGSPVTFSIFIEHTPESRVDAFDIVVTDALPPNFEFIPSSLQFTGLAPSSFNYDAFTATLTFFWDVFPLGQSSTIAFQAAFVGPSPATNTTNVAWTSLPIDPQPNGNPVPLSQYNNLATERWYDPGDTAGINNYGASSSVMINAPSMLPATGFAPNRVTWLPPQPAEKAYTNLGALWLEIPSLGLKLPIVGVPLTADGWDVTWLWRQAGWLEGSAFPTHAGNSALTAHVHLPDGTPGPFIRLGDLRWGDQIIVHLAGQRYIYEVRQVRQVSPYSLSPLRSEEYPWLTLITCREYDEKRKEYRSRIVVRAVQIRIEDQ